VPRPKVLRPSSTSSRIPNPSPRPHPSCQCPWSLALDKAIYRGNMRTRAGIAVMI